MRFWIFIVLLNCNLVFSQNLVPNPSFEEYTTCPTLSNQLSYALPWVNPTSIGTPDFYHGCSSTFGTPSYCNCDYAYQYANTGIGYSGIGCYGVSTPNGREYIQTQLNSPLIINKCYLIDFYVNLLNGAKYACNNLALNFSISQPTLTGSSSLLNLTPHILDFQNRIMTDTLNWKSIKGIYIANGDENYITIGIFSPDTTIDTVTSNSNGLADGSYYNIDDVSVISIDDIPGNMPAFAGNDVTISQEGDSAFIGQEISNLNCNWSILGGTQIATNISGLFVQPTTTTTYVVEQTLCGTITYDTVTVYVTVDLEELNELTNLEIYPNPTSGKVIVSSSNLTAGELQVFVMDVTGKEVYNVQLSLNEGISHFNLDGEVGTYFVTFINLQTNEKIVKKLTLQK